MENLKCVAREKNKSHYPSSKRRQGKVPGVLYGATVSNTLLECGELEVNSAISRVGEHGTVSLDLNNMQCKAMIKEVQRNPVTHKVIHIDLEEVCDDQVVQAEVPILFEGESWINNKGGIIQKEKSSIKVQGKYKEIPKNVKVDLAITGIGGVVRVSDLEFARELSIVDDIDTVIASITNYSVGASSEEEEKQVAQAIAKEIHMEE